MMNCTLCRELVSEYLDFQVDDNLRAEMEYHLSLCPVCQSHVRETEFVRSALGGLSDRTVPREFSQQWVAALEQSATQTPRRRFETFDWRAWMVSMRPMIAGYGVGVAVTFVLFAGILFSFKPSMSWQSDFRLDYSPPTRPSMQADSRGLPTLPDVMFVPVNGNNINNSVVFIAEVSPQGKAQLVQMETPRSDPQTTAAVNAVLDQSSFEPAQVGGRPVTSRVIILMEQIYVRG